MIFTLSWLKEHLETEADAGDISRTLTNIGLEVESIEDHARLYTPFRVALVEKVDRHPDADKLKICQVNTGEETVQVVCGAPNARAGMKGIFAPEGAFIPGTEITLKKGIIRGQESRGMLVSEREMGLSQAHEGIIEIDQDTPVGKSFADVYELDEIVFTIGLTPNRVDCACVRGIARDLAAAGLGGLKDLVVKPVKKEFDTPISVELDFSPETQNACPLFIGRLIRNVQNEPSPDWLQAKLKAIGLRPISALVDITNLMTINLNRPLHVYDADKLQGNLKVHLSKGGETLETLNDKSYILKEGMTVISDESGIISLAGIIGGTSTAVDENTKNVYIEAAYFDPLSTARAGRTLQINSDARFRFERGIDPTFTQEGVEMATGLILQLCGGTAGSVEIAGSVPSLSKEITYNPAKVAQLIGINVPVEEQVSILKKLGFLFGDKRQGHYTITVPPWRGDVQSDVCLVEEVTRIHGLEHVPTLPIRQSDTALRFDEPRSRRLIRQSRSALLVRGLEECITWSFMSKELAALFGSSDNHLLTLENPISSDLNQMRPSILPNLLQAARETLNKGLERAAFFENGPIFQTSQPGGQSLISAGIRAGTLHPKHWSTGGTARVPDIFDAKADVLAALKACDAPDTLPVSRDAPDYYHPGRSGSFRLGKNILANFGEIHPAILTKLDLEAPVSAFEIYLENIPAPRQKNNTAKPFLKRSSLQPVKRDFAFIVDQGVEAEDLIRAVKSGDKNLISTVQVFDVYQGKGVETDKKSIALEVTMQPQDHTLTDSELEGLSKKIIANVRQKTGGVLRS